MLTRSLLTRSAGGLVVPGGSGTRSSMIRAGMGGQLMQRGVALNPQAPLAGLGFDLLETTGVINRTPPAPSEVGMRLPWAPRPVTKRIISFEDYGHKLEVVEPTKWRGGEPQRKGKAKRSIMPLNVYRHALNSTLTPDEIAGKRKLGTDITVMTVEDAVTDLMMQHSQDHELTWERDRILGLQGMIPNDDGGYDDLFQGLKSQKTTEAIAMNAAGLKCRDVITKLKRKVEKTLSQQYRITGYQFILGTNAFDSFTNHASWEKMVEREDGSTGQGSPLRQDLRGGYTTQGNVGISSYDYADYVAPNKGYFCPIIENFYLDFFAPMNAFETNDTMGLPEYANVWASPDGRTLNVDTESNAIHLPVVPEAIVEVTFSNM